MSTSTENKAENESELDTERASDSNTDTELSETILELVDDIVDAEPDGVPNESSNVWTSERYLDQQATKSTTDFDRDKVATEVQRLISEDRLISWFGLIAPATDEHLLAIIENEVQAGVTRTNLVQSCNRIRARKKEANEESDG